MAIINGNAFANWLVGTADPDELYGFDGADTLDGGLGADTLVGGLGDDDYYVDTLADVIVEDAVPGIDEVFTALNQYTLSANVENVIFTGTGNFIGTGNAISNFLKGGDGADTLDGGFFNDTMAGGAGDDDYYVDNAWDQVWEDAVPGIDEVFTTLNSYTLPSNVENVIFIGTGDFTGTGNGISNLLKGGAGNDTLDGGAFSDTMWGGVGDDVYYVDNNWDQVWEDAGQGTDEVRTTLSDYTLGTHVENLTYIGDGDFIGTGNALDNILAGGAGDDRLDGKGGNNVLIGGAGADVFVFDAAGNQTVTDFGIADDRVEVTGFASAEEALGAVRQVGSDAVLFSGTSTLVLLGVNADDLTAANFTGFGV